MKTIKKQPKIRFKGYTDEWQQRKLNEFMDFSNGINAPKENYGKGRKMISVMDILSPNKITYQNIRNSVSVSEAIESKNKVENGDLIFVRSSEIVQEVGLSKAYTDSEYALYSGFSIRGKRKSEYNPLFMEINLNNGAGRKQIERKAGGSTRFNVSQEILNSIDVLMPIYEEQNKIADVFENINNTIALHQRKLEALEKTKKSFLQKMFPKKDETKPEIRFAGFTDDWEQRKLGKIGKTQSGVGFPNTEQGGTEGIPFFKVSDMNNEGNENEMITANNYVSKEQIERKKWKPIEDVPAVIFAKVGAAIMLNRKRIVRSLFLLDNNTMAYIFDNSWDADFGKTMFETINLPKYAQVGALPSYNSSDIENISIVIPNVEEQQKIGSFFKQLDDTIALHQRQLEVLKNMKTSFLQKMYI